MSEASLPKKMKQTDLWLSSSPEAETKTFMCHLNSETYSVACDKSMTVLDALNKSVFFKVEREKPKNIDKEILIQISKEVPRAAVKTDFPVCLIENDQIIDVTFIKNDVSASMKQQTPEKQYLSKSDFVTFYVKKKGGDKVNCILKSKALRNRVEYVCVYAHKEEKLKKALKSDGRFKDDMFKKHCALSEFGTESKYEMSQPVKNLDQKIFKVVVLKGIKQPDSQDDLTPEVKTEPGVASDADVADGAGTSQNPENTKQDKKHKNNRVKSTRPSAKLPDFKVIPNSDEILGILRDQFKGLLEKLKERENLKTKSQVQNFFRTEFAKSVENFSEVKKVRKLMRLSDSVCQIRFEGSARGTGFLLFNRFILTNAHVIGKFNLSTVNPAEFTAVFDYEDLNQNSKRIPIINLTCSLLGKEFGAENHLDYALLELESVDKIAGYPELLSHCRQNSPENRSQICIVGHPGNGVKKMDPCFIIEKENELEAANKHISENINFFQVMFERNLEEKWGFHKNQISYDSCFFHGSSGSPVFDEDCKLIGVHTGGYVYPGEGGKTRSIMEYAYSIEPILAHIKAQARIKGRKDIVNILESNSKGINQSSTTEQPNQTDSEMETK